jgi:plastocyanin
MAVLAAAGALALTGCGSSDKTSSGSGASSASTSTPTSTPTASGGGGGGGQKLALAADPGGALSFDKKTLDAKAGKVTIAFKNASSTPHAVEIEGKGVEAKSQVVTGGSSTVSATLKPGTYDFYCPVDGHRAAGMAGKLVVK